MFRLYDYSLIGRDGERARYPLWTVESRTTGDWRDRIVQRHPQLFRNERGRMPGYPQVGPGWAELIGLAVERIAKATRNGTAPVRIFEVKEKYGTLRLHTDRIDDPTAAAAVEEAIALAETRSACTCEVCGEEGGLYERGDVLATLCGRHARGVPVEVRPGWENIRIVRALRDGRIVSCRRYLRPKDAFVDIPPFAIGLKVSHPPAGSWRGLAARDRPSAHPGNFRLRSDGRSRCWRLAADRCRASDADPNRDQIT